VAKVGTSNPDRTISPKRLQCVVENKHTRWPTYKLANIQIYVGHAADV
jgi:hypothetical protein